MNELNSSLSDSSSAPSPVEVDQKPQVLLVDDEPSILMSLSAILKYTRPACAIRMAASAEEALDILKSTKIDLLITDLKLPAMDGLSLVQTTLERNPETRSILMTAYGTDRIDYGAYHSGCINYLEKPFELERLLASIDETLAHYQEQAVASQKPLLTALDTALESDSGAMLKVSDGGRKGLLCIRDEKIHYADFDGLLGISALVEILRAESLQVEQNEGAADISNSDLPVSVQSLVDASAAHSDSAQIALLRESGRSLRENSDSQYPDEQLEPKVQGEMLAELVQYRRERRLSTGIGSKLQRKRLHFYQSLGVEMLERQVRLRKLVNSGVEHFSSRNYLEAEHCWLEALAIDPHCQQAKHNLALLEERRLAQ